MTQARLMVLVMTLVLACGQVAVADPVQGSQTDDDMRAAIQNLNESLNRQRTKTRRLSISLGIASMALGAGLVAASEGSSSEGTSERAFESDTRVFLGVSGAVAVIVGFAVFVGGLRGDPELTTEGALGEAYDGRGS